MKSLNILALALSALGVTASAAPVFRNPQPIPIPTQNLSTILTADFNGDGHEDLMMVSPAEALAVALANGSGPFAPAVLTQLPYAPTERPATGDVNGDGKIDVVVSDWSTKTVAAMLGNGDGTFRLGPTFTTTILTGAVALADFTGDGKLDVAVGDQDTHASVNAVEVYAGNGMGSFSGRRSTEVQDAVRALRPADLNGDRKIDLVATSTFGSTVLINDGTGVFTATDYLADGGNVIADFNRDGKPDVAVAAGGNHEWYVQVELGNGDGTLTPSARYAVGYDSDSIATADVDEDGNIDLLAAGWAGSVVSVLRGKADGTFHAAELWLSGPGTWQIVTGDFNRDGNVDFVTADYNADELWALSYVRGNGNGTFAAYRSFHTNPNVPVSWPGLQARGGVLEDMNDDGHTDVVVSQKHAYPEPDDLAVLLNDGSGKLAQPILTGTEAEGWSGGAMFAIGDVNGDGDPDAVVLADYGSNPTAATLLGDGAGRFPTRVPFPVAAFGRPRLGHFNGDSNLDLFVAAGYAADVYPGNGNGTFGAAIRTTGEAPHEMLLGDLNGDGRTDAVSGWIRSTIAYLNDGTGRFVPATVTNDEITAAALGDFNGDAKLDLLFITYGGTQVRFGKGDGTFGAGVSCAISPLLTNSPNSGPVATADVDGDGKLDVAFGTSVYLGRGDGTFSTRSRFRTNLEGTIAFADMDGNGSPDLVVTKSSADDVDVLLTGTTADPTAPSSITLTSDAGTTAQYGQSVMFTATVSGAVNAFGGVVRFALDGVPAGLVAVNKDGQAKLNRAFAVGSYSITATYVGDENYLQSTASTTLAVTKARSQVSLQAYPNPAPVGAAVRLYVEAFAPLGYGSGMLPPTGTMSIREGDTQLATISGTYGTPQVRFNTVGEHVITAYYTGDDNYEPSSATYTQETTKPVPGIGFTTTPSPIVAGSPVTLRAFFHSTTITGTVSFRINDVLVKTLPLVQGAAQFDRTFTWGNHVVTITYSGDENWAPSERGEVVVVYGGQWGTAPAIAATGRADARVMLQWSQIVGANEYTIWRKTSHTAPWEVYDTVSGGTSAIYGSMPAENLTWLFAITARDANGNVSPMSAPDLATTVGFTDAIVSRTTAIKAMHMIELRAAIAAVRKFAGLPVFSYTNPIAVRRAIRALDMRELRIALSEARSTIGFPPIAFTDNVLTPGTTFPRAAHVNELRAGVN